MHIAVLLAVLHATAWVLEPVFVGVAIVACVEVDIAPDLVGAASVTPIMWSI